MKYFSRLQIEEALDALKPHNPFFGITFLVLKRARVPVGSKVRLRLDAENKSFLEEHYRVHPKSAHFFRVFRSNRKTGDWVKPDYASKTVQAINTQTFQEALLHEKNDNAWGWSHDYLTHLANRLPRSGRMSLFHLAVWIYRNRQLEENWTRADVVDLFATDFELTADEASALFETRIDSVLNEDESFQALPVPWHEILMSHSTPEDVPAESSGTLNYLNVEGVGPVRPLLFQPSERLNLITGDNGLGKTFLLDLSWWALTQGWADRPATPTNISPSRRPYIEFAVGGTGAGATRADYEPATGVWTTQGDTHVLSGLAVYAMLNGSFAVWDPANRPLSRTEGTEASPTRNFTREEIWDGKPGQLEGLIRDWVKWQHRPDLYPAYSTFEAVLQRVFPRDLGPIEIGEPVRIPNDAKEIPTLTHPYGNVPILFESAGIRRTITLAYLLVWAWEEHKIQAKQQGRQEERQMIVLVDEAEAHLHPRWQRAILPALLGVGSDLHREMSVQWIIASHSPLVMASGEAIWNADTDALFHLDMGSRGNVSFELVPFERRGTIDSWLSSEIFELPRPGSMEREMAIEAAVALQEQDEPTAVAVEEVTAQLRMHLPSEDPFWVRWIFFAESYGVSP